MDMVRGKQQRSDFVQCVSTCTVGMSNWHCQVRSECMGVVWFMTRRSGLAPVDLEVEAVCGM